MMERRYEEESANDKAMESLFLLLPKNDLLERGKKLQKIASKFSDTELPQCESNLKLLSKSLDGYISKLTLQNESLGVALAEKRRHNEQMKEWRQQLKSLNKELSDN
ncbi:uncharacterized protein [Penaeus vannamei]|uniref:uncharacterized protein n=1 Tax=Penaeus vannamei TaxID=6689 RepID=UPI00387FAB1B